MKTDTTIARNEFIHRPQTAELFAEGFKSSQIFQQTILHKLRGYAQGAWWLNFQRCGREIWYRTCQGCGETKEYYYSCNQKWCPACNWKITERRKRELEIITRGLTQPKHLVLTQKNFEVLTRRKIVGTRNNLVKLRRKKMMADVRGGCCSLEFTNENRGWHMHWHILVDARWINMESVAKKWGELVDQEFAIVKVKDVRGHDYLKEVCKYVVTGAEIAGWPGELILQFIHALKGTRLFSVFGSFREKREAARLEIARSSTAPICKCGSDRFKFENDELAVQREIREAQP